MRLHREKEQLAMEEPCMNNGDGMSWAEDYNDLTLGTLKKEDKNTFFHSAKWASSITSGRAELWEGECLNPNDPQTCGSRLITQNSPQSKSCLDAFKSTCKEELPPFCNEGLMLFDLQFLAGQELCPIIPWIEAKPPRTYSSPQL
jgi:hypothetical protein